MSQIDPTQGKGKKKEFLIDPQDFIDD